MYKITLNFVLIFLWSKKTLYEFNYKRHYLYYVDFINTKRCPKIIICQHIFFKNQSFNFKHTYIQAYF